MNVDTVLQGLYITVVGMGLVFLALGLLVAAMTLMGRYLGPRTGSDREGSEPDSATEERARVAAMAAAIVLAGGRDEEQPGDAWRLAGTAPSPWQATHRAQALAHRPGRAEKGEKCL